MSAETPVNSVPGAVNTQEAAMNFRKQQEHFQRILAEKEARIAELEATKKEVQNNLEDDEYNDDPYIDQKRLNKTLFKERESIKQQTQLEIQRAVQEAIEKERQQTWIKNNPDFFQTMSHAEKLEQADPELAETILKMPDTFERQKLVYKNIKALGLHKPPEDKKSIQQTIDNNKKNLYYQPGMPAAPYGSFTLSREVSKTEGEQALAKMRELQRKFTLN